jgi:hypothetical protein
MTLGLVIALLLGTAALAPAAERPGLRDRETPRATDLSRAQRAADKAKERLRMPRAPVHGWVRGGSGWGAAPAPPAARKGGDVVINVRPPRE